MDGPYMEATTPGFIRVSRFTLKEIFVEWKHIAQFVLSSGSQDSESWAELATSMPHVQWLDLTVNTRDCENDKGEIEPFRMAGLPSLTFLQLCRSPDRRTSSLSLHLPALLSLHHSLDSYHSSPPHDLGIQCPKLESLRITMERGMVIAPSLFSNLRSLEVTFHIVSVNSSKSLASRFSSLKLAGVNLEIAPCSL